MYGFLSDDGGIVLSKALPVAGSATTQKLAQNSGETNQSSQSKVPKKTKASKPQSESTDQFFDQVDRMEFQRGRMNMNLDYILDRYK